jgi:hypothetical protein
MTWQQDPTGKMHSLYAGACTATIQRAGDGTWRGMVEGHRTAVRFANFTTLAEAQAWCLHELAELQAMGVCYDDARA